MPEHVKHVQEGKKTKAYLTIQGVNQVLYSTFKETLDDQGILLMTRNVYNSIAYDEKFGNEGVVGQGEAAQRMTVAESNDVVPGINFYL